MEARHHVALAAHPRKLSGVVPFERRIEERLPEAPHIDNQNQAALRGHRRGCASRAPRPPAHPCAAVAVRVLAVPRAQDLRSIPFCLVASHLRPEPWSLTLDPCSSHLATVNLNDRRLVDPRTGGGVWPAP